METETLTYQRVTLADSMVFEDAVVLQEGGGRKPRSLAVLTKAELRQLVQQAYDQYGVSADPFATPGSADA